MVEFKLLPTRYFTKNLDSDILNLTEQLKTEILNFTQFYDKIAYTKELELFIHDKKSKKLGGIDSRISFTAFIGNLLYVGTNSGELRIFIEKRKCISIFSDLESEIVGIYKLVTQSSKEPTQLLPIIICLSADGKIAFYDITQDTAISIIDVNEPIQTGITTTTAENNILYVITSNGKLLEIENGKIKELVRSERLSKCSKLIYYRNNFYTAVANKLIVWEFSEIDEDGKRDKLIEKMIKPLHLSAITEIYFYDDILYSCSLDGYIKTWAIDTSKSNIYLLNSFCLNEPIISFFISQKVLTVGTKNGNIYKTREQKTVKEEEEKRFQEEEEEIKIKRKKPYEADLDVRIIKKESRVDELEKLLLTFNYKKAYELTLENWNIQDYYFVLNHCKEKGMLKRLFKDQSRENIKLFLEFSIEYFSYKEFYPFIYESLIIITSLYERILVESDFINILDMLNEKITEEFYFQEIIKIAIGFTSE